MVKKMPENLDNVQVTYNAGRPLCKYVIQICSHGTIHNFLPAKGVAPEQLLELQKRMQPTLQAFLATSRLALEGLHKVENLFDDDKEA